LARTEADGQAPVGGEEFRLRLYVAGSGARSLRAVQNITRICEVELAGRYSLEVIDIYKEPHRVTEDQVLAIPTLIKQSPGHVRHIVGDLSEISILRQILSL
jgi:circadian clock protein KaiB